MTESPFTVKNFVYPVEQFGKCLQTVCYDVQIPLPDPNSAPSDLFGHLIAQNRLPLPFQKEVKAAFEKFVRDEARKFDAELATRRIEFALNGGGGGGTSDDGEANGDANKAIGGANATECDAQTLANTAAGGPLFEEQFQHVMRHATAAQLSLLVREESRMTEEMRALVRARNFEVERIKRACEGTLANSIGATEFDKHSYELSMLNEKLRQVSINYSNQIEALNERQRDEYRQLVRALYANETDGVQQKESTLASSSSCFGFATTAASASPPVRPQPSSSRLFKKSFSYDSKMAQHVAAALGTGINVHQQTTQCRSESFTIYIGAQLKTMHNARILTSDRLVDLMMLNNDAGGGIGISGAMTSAAAAATADGIEQEETDNIGTAGMTATPLCHSQRLQLLMNLYRRDLACAILIVGGCDPLWHVKERTNFVQLCEQSAELHFESLERQLTKIEQDVRSANRDRRAACQRRRQQQRCRGEDGGGAGGSATTAAVPTTSPSASMLRLLTAYDDIVQTAHGQQNGDNFGDENSLRPGDVYVTCHSNLSAVQVVFHVVGDRLLAEQDISSRHPCIGALRNVIRLAPLSAVHHITLPLLLVEHMSETMTMSWCLSRAELVFKCLKGFLMEVCSTSGVSIAGGGGAVTASGNAAGTPHFNINFVLPSAISPTLFQELVELFSSIFHSVPSLDATQQQ
ncbi:hypothetical protein GPALN_003225 [Globodera pallida]|nr:hypothetical protein GPALN_003225 [Globodera pallida]